LNDEFCCFLFSHSLCLVLVLVIMGWGA
jgi:hypothetical protein